MDPKGGIADPGGFISVLMLRPAVHIILHVAVPGLFARWRYPARWKSAWGIMLLPMLIDIDHLLANPVYDPNRCSLGVHPLHSYPAMLLYLLLTAWTRTRLLAFGCILHILLDGIDCLWMAVT